MRSNYKKLGPYIRPIDVRNKKLEVELLLGVSIQKILMPSIANTVGTDMSKYKVIRRMQFAYGPVTSRNGDKISVALLEDHEIAILSQAYIVFEVIDHNDLDPEYLMMWFRRSEFDRYARFHSHGSARETFDWEEMCEVELPIPSIEKQREIVTEYNTVVNRIKLNEELNKKLEETAQLLYERFKISEIKYDGEVVADFIENANTGLDAIKRAPIVEQNTGVKCLRIQDVSNKKGSDKWGFTSVEKKNFERFQLKKDDIIIARTGATVGSNILIKKDLNSVFNNGLIRIKANLLKIYPSILFAFFNSRDFKEHVDSIAFGTSTQPNVKIDDLLSFCISFPVIDKQHEVGQQLDDIFRMMKDKSYENQSLERLSELILSKMAHVEVEEKEVVG